MPLISTNQPNLINGVSQQADSLKFATQAVEQINGYSSIVDGLIKRNPTRHVKRLISGSITGTPFIHTINRDTSEQYEVVIQDGSIRVFDLTGTEKSVNDPYYDAVSGKTTYLAGVTPNDLRVITIADYTFVLNKNKTVAMKSDLTASLTSAASVFIQQGAYSVVYNLTVGGTTVSITSGTTAGAAGTDTIAEQLRAALVANATINGWYNITRSGSLIYITGKLGQAVVVNYTDSVGNTYGKVANDVSTSVAGLPTTATNNQLVRITGGTDGTTDDYWVKFVTDSGATYGVGKWRETVAPATQYLIDPATMPHVLIRLASGSFLFCRVDGTTQSGYTLPSWGQRNYGTAESNPNPSFVGKKINDITLFRGRLALASGENIILSESNKFFNFFRTTLQQLLDSDPIDVAVTSAKVSVIYNMIPFSEKLLLFSDQSQFSLTSADVLTPKTVSIQQTTEFTNYRYTKPISLGKTVHFPFTRGSYSGVMEYYVSPLTSLFDGLDITAPVSKYISGNITKMVGSSNEQVVIVMADGMKNGVFVYKYFYNGEDKIQSAWSKWMFDVTAEVVNVDFINSTLYLVVKRPDGLYLEFINIESGFKDAYSDFTTRLDRRVTELSCTLSYNASADTTVVTLPYNYVTADNPVIVTRDTASVEDTGGIILASQAGNHAALFSGNQQYLEASTSADSSVEANSWSAAGWVKFHSLQPLTPVFSVGDSSDLGGFEVMLDDSGKRLRATGSPSNGGFVQAQSGDTLTVNTWYFVTVWYDSTDRILRISVNNGTAGVSSASSNISENYYIGTQYYLNGEMDQWAFWKRTLTSTERTYLYGAGSGVSYFDIPDTLKVNMTAWWRLEEAFGTRNDEQGNLPLNDYNGVGNVERIVPYAYSTLTVKGNLTNQPFYAGVTYDMVYTFSTPLIRQTSGQGKVAVTDGRLQVKNGLLTYANSLSFSVNVTPKYRNTYTYNFTGPRLGTGGSVIGQQELVSGAFRFPVMSKNTDVTVELHNDSPFPCALLSMDWESHYHVRNQRT